MSYPIKNETELYLFIEENKEILKKIVERNKDKIKDLLINTDNKLLEEHQEILLKNKQQQEEIIRLQENNDLEREKIRQEQIKIEKEREELSKRENLLKSIDKVQKNNTPCSYGIGESFELNLQLSLENNEMIKTDWIVDGKKKNHCMDIRLQHKNYKECHIGIELKDKQTVTCEDIKKFETDKVKNNFTGNIFISTTPILDIKKLNLSKIHNNNLMIVSKDITYICNCICIYLQCIEQLVKNDVNIINTDDDENILLLYKHNQSLKRQLKKGDELYLQILQKKLTDSEYKKIIGRHLFILSRAEALKNNLYDQ